MEEKTNSVDHVQIILKVQVNLQIMTPTKRPVFSSNQVVNGVRGFSNGSSKKKILSTFICNGYIAQNIYCFYLVPHLRLNVSIWTFIWSI